MTVDLSTINVPQLVNAVLAIATIIGTAIGIHGQAVKVKAQGIATKAQSTTNSLSDVFAQVHQAAIDGTVTEAEFQSVLSDATAIYNNLNLGRLLKKPSTIQPASTVSNSTTTVTPPSTSQKTS